MTTETSRNSGRVTIDRLRAFSIEAMVRSGFRRDDAIITTEVLTTTDTWGIYTHGTNHLGDYLRKARAGGIDPQAVPEVVKEGPGWALVDGHAAMGMVTAYKGMELAIAKAKTAGLAYVGTKDSTHFGAAGYYAWMAAREGMVGLAMSNADPNMTVPGGKGNVIGNNPMAFAAPRGEGNPILVDIALSTTAASKIWAAKALGIPVPETWLTDGDGLPTTDPTGWPKAGSLLPAAAHKGYGLAMMVEVLAAVCTGAGVVKEVASWDQKLSSRTNTGHAFLALNIEMLLPLSEFESRLDRACRDIKASPKAKGSETIYLPGEKEWNARAVALKEGITFPKDVVNNLNKLAQEVNIDPMQLWGEQ